LPITKCLTTIKQKSSGTGTDQDGFINGGSLVDSLNNEITGNQRMRALSGLPAAYVQDDRDRREYGRQSWRPYFPDPAKLTGGLLLSISHFAGQHSRREYLPACLGDHACKRSMYGILKPLPFLRQRAFSRSETLI